MAELKIESMVKLYHIFTGNYKYVGFLRLVIPSKQPCLHGLVFTCDDYQGMKNVLQEALLGIEESSWTPYGLEQREDLLYEFDRAKSDIILWKAHIIRSINQEEAKQDALRAADDTSAILIMDWPMKLLQMRYREKQSNWFGKRGLRWHIYTLYNL